MKRDVGKFLAGSFAALAYAHAAFAVAASRGIIEEPVFLGRKWGINYMWTEAAVYSAASLTAAYFGWFANPEEPTRPVPSATIGQAGQNGVANEAVTQLTPR